MILSYLLTHVIFGLIWLFVKSLKFCDDKELQVGSRPVSVLLLLACLTFF